MPTEVGPFGTWSSSSKFWTEVDKSLLDARGWPLGHPAPPRVTNWYKLAANILVLAAMAAALWWLAKWSCDMCRAIKLQLNGARPGNVRTAWIAVAILCFVGTTAIVWGIAITEQISFGSADRLMTSTFDPRFAGRDLKSSLLPPLYVASGLLALAAARKWLQADARKVKMTSMVLALFVVLAFMDGMEPSVRELPFSFIVSHFVNHW
ncbi:MAG: hypothetical protein K8T91_08560 [Planctomycetes bacterium]|nr:hypothetical protein [Planctomycetota bacterium]